jgi:type I phosphodiesterase/nucleotide pyrophosphatase
VRLDDLILDAQHLVDRLVRRVRLGPAPIASRRRLLVVQIDGLSRDVLERALARGTMPFLARLLRRGHRMEPMSVGIPSSTPAFQLAAMYGVRPDIPGFHYHDKRRGADVYFPRGGDAAYVETTQAAGCRGILAGGASYGCVFTGGAEHSLWSFARIKRPTGRGVARAVSAFVVLGWVVVKSLVLTVLEIGRAVLRLLGNPTGETARGWKWLAIKVGLSVWVRQLFTLSVSRDVYAGVPAIYVNYLDYDVFAHSYGPRHPLALRALRRIDRSLRQLARVVRRVPEHRYDLYLLSDHGQAPCVPYQTVSGGRPFERRLLEDFLHAPTGGPRASRRERLVSGMRGYRRRRAPGLFQRFLNYLEDDFPWALGGDLPEARERGDVRVIGAGPNGFVYFLATPEPVPLEWIEERYPGLVDDIARSAGIGTVLVRSARGPLCLWRGKRYRLDEIGDGPFAGRDDLDLVVDGFRDLMAMPSAGDLVLYGTDAPEGNTSFVVERGAHAGASPDEMQTFIVVPPGVELGAPVRHPRDLYPHFLAYQDPQEPA